MIASQKTNTPYQVNKYNSAGVYVLLLALMQLNEFFLWIYNKRNLKHQIASICIIITLALQFYINFGLAMGYNMLNQQLQSLFIVCVVIMTLGMLYNLKNIFKQTYNSDPITCGNLNIFGCRLKWDVLDKLYGNTYISRAIYIIMMIVYFIVVGTFTYLVFDVPGIAIWSVLLGLSMLEYGPTQFGSMWCFLVMFFSILVLLTLPNTPG